MGIPSLKGQILYRLDSMKAYGESKHEDKKLNGGKPAKDKMYGYGSMITYKGVGVRFAKWAKEHGCRTLDDAKPLISQYLRERIDKGLKADTINKDASALEKIFQIERYELGVELPPRRRADVTLHRSKDTWKGHFSETRNRDLVDLCLATGMRRCEILRMRPDDVHRNPDGCVTVEVLGQGGKEKNSGSSHGCTLEACRDCQGRGKGVCYRAYTQICSYPPVPRRIRSDDV